MTSGAPSFEQFLREVAEAAQRFGLDRYQAGFRAGILAAERRHGELRRAVPPPVPDHLRTKPIDDNHATPVQPTEWPYARPRSKP